jgi:two-component system phosphate regulon sensor histidine kinase PhoR
VGGTGLGLSIVKHIAMLFDAKLRVESQIGEGTTFYVTFMKDEEKEHNT